MIVMTIDLLTVNGPSCLLVLSHVRELLFCLLLEVTLFAAAHRPSIHGTTQPIHPLRAEITSVARVMEIVLGGGCVVRDVERIENGMNIECVARMSFVGVTQTFTDPNTQGPRVRSHEQTTTQSGDEIGQNRFHGMSILSREAHSALPLVVLLMDLPVQGRAVQCSMRPIESHLVKDGPRHEVKVESKHGRPVLVEDSL